jgi:tripartite-type tricarboxylate transporter receptor subunit TctC
MVVRNMPGGGGVTMSNHLYNLAPKDGTTIAVMDQTVLLNEFLQEGINYKTANFTWIGRLAPALALVMLYHTAPIHSLAEMKDQEIIFASSGKGSQTYMIPTLMRTLLGYKTRVVMGYEGAAQIYLAMERGEVQARTGTIEALLAGHPDWVETGKIRILAELSLEKQPSIPDLPMLTQLARNPEDRAVLDFIASFTALGFPYAAPPGIPPERAQILRRAFDQAVASPELIAEMKRSSMTVGPATGETMQALTARYSQLSPELLARTKRALEW